MLPIFWMLPAKFWSLFAGSLMDPQRSRRWEGGGEVGWKPFLIECLLHPSHSTLHLLSLFYTKGLYLPHFLAGELRLKEVRETVCHSVLGYARTEPV